MKKYPVVAAAFFCLFLLQTMATAQSTSPAQQSDTEKKQALYGKFETTYKTDTKAAYDAAREYLDKYSADKDDIVDFLNKWVNSHQKEYWEITVWNLIYNDANYPKAFEVGRQVLKGEPECLRTLVDLGYAGFPATRGGLENVQAEAIGYAEHAIKLIEQGQTLPDWAPFQDKSDTLGWLNFSLGVMNLKTGVDKASPYFFKALGYPSKVKEYAPVYYYIAASYEDGPYKKASEERKKFAGKEETPEGKQALESANRTLDHIIDAYARAIALTTRTDADSQNAKNQWMARAIELYKFRHDGSDAGLKDFIAGVLSKPFEPLQDKP
ncbi:MAG TPA: hypothetical protein VFC63_27095 [Blastocatellia bacterium]|nr:hypothetical protein [Blastocatellia bacterium]